MPDQTASSKENVVVLLALTEKEKDRLKAEEIYREEVRKALASPRSVMGRLFVLLNTPLGIFALSALLLSGGSLLFSMHKESKEKENARREEIASLSDEIVFRENQLDAILRWAEKDGQSYLAQTTNSTKDTDILQSYAYRKECQEVGATVRKGGLTSPPGDPDNVHNFRIADVALGADLFPNTQGYKSPAYKFFSVADVGKKVWELEHPNDDPSREIDRLNNELHGLDDAALKLVRSRMLWTAGTYALPGLPINNPHQVARTLDPLVKVVRNKFELIRRDKFLTGAVQ